MSSRPGFAGKPRAVAMPCAIAGLLCAALGLAAQGGVLLSPRAGAHKCVPIAQSEAPLSEASQVVSPAAGRRLLPTPPKLPSRYETLSLPSPGKKLPRRQFLRAAGHRATVCSPRWRHGLHGAGRLHLTSFFATRRSPAHQLIAAATTLELDTLVV
jgi:hypothetical protein